jgi:hypothetical protein
MKLLFIILFLLTITTSSQQTQWTVQTLKEHYDYVLKERDEKINQKFESIELAVTKADEATEKRFESVNEFRAQLADQQRTFILRSEYEAGHKELTNRVDDIKLEVEKINNEKTGRSVVLAYVVAGISLMIAVYNVKDKVLKNNNLK